MSPIETDVADDLLSYISGSRWFAGKGRLPQVVGRTPLPWLSEPGSWPAVRLEVVEIGYTEQPGNVDSGVGDDSGAGTVTDPDSRSSTTADHELYQLALSYRSVPEADNAAGADLNHAEVTRTHHPDLGPVVVYDAMRDPDACRLIIRLLLEERRLVDQEASVRFRLSNAGGLSADLEPQIFTGQQSNTSVMFGDVAMMKLFRRLEIGHNLDIEVHDALSRAGVADVAQLFGWMEASWPQVLAGGSEPQLVTSDLAMVVAKLPSAEDGWAIALDSLRDEDGTTGETLATRFADDARQLGTALAEIHGALREHFPVSSVPGAQVAEVMKRRLDRAAVIAPALQPHVPGLREAFDTLAGLELPTQRVHGDFHLGQTLRTPDGWKIIDFEGEPVKSLAERAEPDNVWRDIAGMLRSFAYAAASVPGPHSHAWAETCRAAFLEGYAGNSLSTADAAALRAYEADKAVYEVVYEVRNRPDWVSIPLAAVAALSQPPDAPGTSDPSTNPSPHNSAPRTKE